MIDSLNTKSQTILYTYFLFYPLLVAVEQSKDASHREACTINNMLQLWQHFQMKSMNDKYNDITHKNN